MSIREEEIRLEELMNSTAYTGVELSLLNYLISERWFTDVEIVASLVEVVINRLKEEESQHTSLEGNVATNPAQRRNDWEEEACFIIH